MKNLARQIRAGEALWESEEQLRDFLDNANELIQSVSPEGRFVYANRKWRETLGYSEDELARLSLFDIVHPDSQAHCAEVFQRTLSGQRIEYVEALFVTKDGREISVEGSASCRFLDERPASTRGILHDVSERKRTEKALRRRTAELEALREVGLEITGQLDLDAVLHSIVSRAIELLGATKGGLYLVREEQDVLEWTTWVCQHAVPADVVLHRGEGLSGRVWETGEPLIVDDYRDWEGRPAVWDDHPVVAVMGVPVRWGPSGAGGEFLGVLEVAPATPCAFSPADADLLSLFAGQAAIAIQNAWLYDAERQRAKELQVAYDQLQRAQQALVKADRLVAMSQIGVTVRHEINNPLTAVLGNAQRLLAADRTLSANSREEVAEIEKAACRIRDVVRRLDEVEDRPIPYLGETMMIDIHSEGGGHP